MLKTKLVLKEKVNNNSTYFFNFIIDTKKVGFFQLREKISAGVGTPKHMGSNIYYEIEPKYRNKGLGMELLKLGLKEAGKLSFHKVVISVLENNIPSKKIIEKTGGIFVEKAKSTNGMMLKYNISLI